ncbi:hypothetical protein FQN51_009058 [Onygenales sp. PD_10]|nr:hypothetical protein FQN51_009058 [Onygenales sp. PD_10]
MSNLKQCKNCQRMFDSTGADIDPYRLEDLIHHQGEDCHCHTCQVIKGMKYAEGIRRLNPPSDEVLREQLEWQRNNPRGPERRFCWNCMEQYGRIIAETIRWKYMAQLESAQRGESSHGDEQNEEQKEAEDALNPREKKRRRIG